MAAAFMLHTASITGAEGFARGRRSGRNANARHARKEMLAGDGKCDNITSSAGGHAMRLVSAVPFLALIPIAAIVIARPGSAPPRSARPGADVVAAADRARPAMTTAADRVCAPFLREAEQEQGGA